MIDTARLKQSIDCRALVASSLGEPARRSGRTWQWRCCFHEDKQPSLTAYIDGWKCYGCDKHGDIFTWLMEREGLSFREAVNRLADGNLPAAALPTVIEPKPVMAEPPDEEWQEKAMQIVAECELALWETAAGAKARKWLNNRGLRDATIEKWHLGFNGADQERHGLFVHRGITLPCWNETDNQMRYVKVRRAIGESKYTQVKGGKPGLCMADTLPGHRQAFICEGEFDALLLWQEIEELAAVCTFGSASAHEIDRWLPSLLAIEQFYIAADNDEAGEAMAAYWLKATKRAVRAVVPAGKDITEYWQSGGDLRAWAEAVINGNETE
jgi:DNA primase